ncbi:MAG: ATPase, T2SS/T4P/T4SS family [Candidatus Thorarchaeota archaeon]
MTNRDVLVVECPNTRCSGCRYFSAPICAKLESSHGTSNHQVKVILLETEKRLIHLGGHNVEHPLEPPWRAEGWESVYIGENESGLQNIVDAYVVGPYLSVFYLQEKSQIVYRSYPLVRTSLELVLLDELSSKTENLTNGYSDFRANISERISAASSQVSSSISESLPEISESTKRRISNVIAHRMTVLGLFFSLLLDDEVEEVFLDRPGAALYFDHQRFGRCHSDFILTDKMVSRLVTLMRAESNLHLDRANPSLKTDMRIAGTILRFSACVQPLSPDGLHLEIRKARSSPYTILDLIRNGTLTVDMAATLLVAIAGRFNITITGGPGSGKTTLMNALDMITPTPWRKIYIEDAVESRLIEGHHQVRIRVDPVDERSRQSDKSIEIVKSLHRSPDYLILGEIQTAEHSQALFQAVAAGLRTIQTCHSDSAASLMSRWTIGHQVDSSSIALMDVIVTLDRPVPGQSRRHVKEIVEVRRDIDHRGVVFVGLNKIFDLQNLGTEVGKWAKDGAFRLRAQTASSKNYAQVFEKAAEGLRFALEEAAIDSMPSLVEELWCGAHDIA